VLIGNVGMNGNRVLSRLAKDQDIIGQSWPKPRGILLQLHKEQGLAVSPDRLRLWILVNRDVAVIEPTFIKMEVNHLAVEVNQADHAMGDKRARHLRHMHAREPSRLRRAEQLSDGIAVVIEKFLSV